MRFDGQTLVLAAKISMPSNKPGLYNFVWDRDHTILFKQCLNYTGYYDYKLFTDTKWH